MVWKTLLFLNWFFVQLNLVMFWSQVKFWKTSSPLIPLLSTLLFLWLCLPISCLTAQKMKFPITDFFSKYDQIRRKSVMQNFIFCAVRIRITIRSWEDRTKSFSMIQSSGSRNWSSHTAQKMKFFIMDFFSKCDQIRSYRLLFLIKVVSLKYFITSNFDPFFL